VGPAISAASAAACRMHKARSTSRRCHLHTSCVPSCVPSCIPASAPATPCTDTTPMPCTTESRWRAGPAGPAGPLKSPGAGQWGAPKREEAPWLPGPRGGLDRAPVTLAPQAPLGAGDKFVPSRGRGASKWGEGGAALSAPVAADARQPFSMGRGRGRGLAAGSIFPAAPGGWR
jgi:hypothetical protein